LLIPCLVSSSIHCQIWVKLWFNIKSGIKLISCLHLIQISLLILTSFFLLIRGHPMFQYQYASILVFISLSYTIYMLYGITHVKNHEIHYWVKPFHNMRLKPCLNLSCIHIACFHHVDNQCHILCFVIYMLPPAHMLNKDIRPLI
jgi:hypothetical protein